MLVCPNCGAQQLDDTVFCDACGTRLGPAGPAAAPPQHPPTLVALKCPACGASTMPGEPFCGNCGASLRPPAPSAPALTCAQCGAALQAGSRFCDACGAAVPVASPPPVPQPSLASQPPAQPPEPAASVGATLRGRLIILSTGAALTFPPGRDEVVIGREDPASGIFPDLDLTRHGGEESGVSRRHARLLVRGGQLFAEDLNSTNYTYVNRLRLTPGQLYPLNDGDELRLGRLKLQYQAE